MHRPTVGAVHAHEAVSPTAPTVKLQPAPASPNAPTGQVTRVPGAEYLALIVPSDEGELTAQAMENWYQACNTDEPFALELTGTTSEQGFVLRASSSAQLELLCKQLEAQYPQCEIVRINPLADPLRLQPGEYALVGTFGLLQPGWKPLKVFGGKALSEPGSDPLVNILAAMEPIESGCRIISQLALVRAPESWLGADVRKTVEHPLQYERDSRSQISQGVPVRSDMAQGKRLIGILALLFGGFLLLQAYQTHSWFLIGLLSFSALLLLGGLLWWNLRRDAHPVYDMKLIAEKMSKAAFYTQLRVILTAQEPMVLPSKKERARGDLLTQQKHRAQSLRHDLKHLQEELEQLSAEQRAHCALPQTQRDETFLKQLEQRSLCVRQTLSDTDRSYRQLLPVLEHLQDEQRTDEKERRDHQQRLLREQKQRLRTCLTGMETAYRQFTQASSNGLVLNTTDCIHATHPAADRLVQVKRALPYVTTWKRLLHRGASSPWVLNSLEVAGMFHLPQESADLPLVRRTPLKQLLFSPEIAQKIQHTPAPQRPAVIGISKQRRHAIPVVLPFESLFSHKAVFGMSRSGKTVLMLLLTWAAMQDVRDATTPQPGIFAIDPHRDFIMDLLKLVAPHPELASRVVLLDLTDTQYPVALNPLDASMGFTRDQAVSNVMSSFQEIWRDFWGPRMAYFLNAICLLLYTLNQELVRKGQADQQYTLLDINPLLQYKEYALKALAQLNMAETWHQELLAWWKNTYFTLPANSSFRQEVIMPILSKMGVFHDNSQLRHIVGQPITHTPVHLAVTEGKIILCALSAKDMSEEAVNILGSTLVNLLHRAFALQQPLALTRRRKVFCALDEFHAFRGSQLDRMLSEDAKLGCSMLLSTQNLKRLNAIRDGLMELVLSNCQHLFAFRVSAADAKLLEEEFQKRVTQKHLISQPTLHCYARLALAGYPISIVSTHLARPASWEDEPLRARQAEDLFSAAQQLRLPVAEVERRSAEHLKRFLDVSAYAEKIDREVRAAEENKHKIAAAVKRAEEQESVCQPGQGQSPPSETTSPSGEPAGMPASPEPIKSTAPKAGSRNHRRSRKMGAKNPVGTAPPEVEVRDTTGQEDSIVEALARFVMPAGPGSSSFTERERSE